MDMVSYSLSKKIAASAVSGVSSMSVDGTTLNIDTNDGQRLQMVFPQPRDGISVTDIDVNANNQIVFTMSDGSEIISGKIPTLKGDAGFSPSAKIEKVGDTATITITDKDGTTTATIKDGSGGGTADVPIEKIKVNGELQTPVNKVVDITVPSIEGLTKDADLATVAKSGDYEDLINKPIIPDITGLATETYVDNKVADYTKTADLADVATSGSYNDLADKPTIPSLDGYAKTNEIPSKVSELENDSNYLSSIPEEYVTDTELNAKGYLTEHQDISGKVDKVEGKSLISDTEIARLASVDNYDDTDIRTELAKKADTTSIPSKVSELTNDSNYQTAEQVNSTVTTEIAKVVADAPEDLNTLKEMSDWIAGHEDDASAMNSAISDNKTAIASLQSGKADKSEIPTTVSELTDSSSYAKKTDIPTTLPADGGNSDTVNNHTVETDVPTDAKFTDTTYSDATQIEHGLMSVDDKKKLDGLKKYTPDGSTITADEDGTLHGVAEVTVDDAMSDTSTNPVQNKVVKAYVDKEVSENVDFSTSTSKLLNGTVEAPLVLSNATRNLLNPTLETTTLNGITCTRNVDANGKPDGTYTLNGTASSDAYFTLVDISKFEDKIYKIVAFKNATSNIFSYINAQSLDGSTIYSILTEYGRPTGYISKNKYKSFDMGIAVISGTTLTNEIVKPMLTTDLSATYDDFVPYSGYDIKTCGKNIVGNPSNFNSPTVKDGVVILPAKSAATNDTYLRLYSNVDISAFDTFRVVVESIDCTINDGDKSFVIVKTKGKKEFSTLTATSFGSSANKYISNVFNCSDFGNKIEEITVVIKKGYAYPGGSYKVSVFNGEDKEFSNWIKYVESSVHIDSTTKFPLLGLKSFNSVTNIISPGNVEVTYAKSDSGKAILDTSENKLDKDNVVNNQTTTEAGFALDARQANPNIDGTLAKQISDLNGSLGNENVIPINIDGVPYNNLNFYVIRGGYCYLSLYLSSINNTEPIYIYGIPEPILSLNFAAIHFKYDTGDNKIALASVFTSSDGGKDQPYVRISPKEVNGLCGNVVYPIAFN